MEAKLLPIDSVIAFDAILTGEDSRPNGGEMKASQTMKASPAMKAVEKMNECFLYVEKASRAEAVSSLNLQNYRENMTSQELEETGKRLKTRHKKDKKEMNVAKKKFDQAVTEVAKFLREAAKDYIQLYPAKDYDAQLEAHDEFFTTVGIYWKAARDVFDRAVKSNYMFDWLLAKEDRKGTGLPSLAELVCPELAATPLMRTQKKRAILQVQGRKDLVAMIAWCELLEWSPEVRKAMVKNEPDNDKRRAMCFLLGIPVPGEDNETLVSESSDLTVMINDAFKKIKELSDDEEQISRKERGERMKKKRELEEQQNYLYDLQTFKDKAAANMAVALMQIFFFGPGTILYKAGETKKMPFNERLLTASRKAALEMRRGTLDTWHESDPIHASADIEASADVEASGFRF